ncbi:MAG: Arc family DNA binding domain-containing protein [Planctomycetota bacterium]|nr:Arc family DNA binding domain-containing protein [Planctomycetota bacterium]
MPKESFLLRTDEKILNALRSWADDELRSANGQLDYILRQALRDAGKLPKVTDKKLRTNSKSKKRPSVDDD